MSNSHKKSAPVRHHLFEQLLDENFQVLTLHHAEAILFHDMPEAVKEIEDVLLNIQLPASELVRGGGGEGQLTQRIRNRLNELGWKKHNFEIKKSVDGVIKESISHEIDHVKKYKSGVFALEIEWNNKDPFYDRDLENFKRLHADGVISVGGIITRGTTLHQSMSSLVEKFAHDSGIISIEQLDAYYKPTPRQKALIAKEVEKAGNFAKGWATVFTHDKFAESTTHWRKLEERVKRGVGNPCPLVLIGIPADIVTFEENI